MRSRIIGWIVALAFVNPVNAYAESPGLLAIPKSIEEPPRPEAAVSSPARQEEEQPKVEDPLNYRGLMRDLVTALADYAKARKPTFVILQQGGFELLVKGDRETRWEADRAAAREAPAITQGAEFKSLTRNLDGVVVEGLYCRPAKASAGTPMPSEAIIKLMTSEGRKVLAVEERCRDPAARAAALERARRDRALIYLSDNASAATPPARPPGENAGHATGVATASNFLLAPAGGLRNAAELVGMLRETNHDIVIVPPYLGTKPLTAGDVTALQFKRLGSRRLVIASVPLGTASRERHYWKTGWQPGSPSWLLDRKAGAGVYDVEYWHPEWKEIAGQYVRGIIDLGYDGILFTGVEAYINFEVEPPAVGDSK